MKQVVEAMKELRKEIICNNPLCMCYLDEIVGFYEMLDSNYRDINMAYIDKDKTIFLVKEFIKEVSYSYVPLFESQDILMVRKCDVEKEIASTRNAMERARLESIKNEGTNMFWFNGSNGFHTKINIELSNTIKDSFFLLHEFMHFLTCNNSGMLGEIVPMFSEFVLMDYLKENNIYKRDAGLYNSYRINSTFSNDKDIYSLLKCFQLMNNDIELFKSNLNKESLLTIKYWISNKNNLKYFNKMLDEDAIAHIIGYYYATRLYESVLQEERIQILNNLITRANNLKDIDYLEYIRSCINNRSIVKGKKKVC